MSIFNNLGKPKASPLQKELKKGSISTLSKVGKGRPPLPNKKAKLLRLDTVIIRALDEWAQKEGLSASQLVAKLVKEHLLRV